MEDLPKYQLSPLVKYRQDKNQKTSATYTYRYRAGVRASVLTSTSVLWTSLAGKTCAMNGQTNTVI